MGALPIKSRGRIGTRSPNQDAQVWHVCRGTVGSVFLPSSECAAPRRAPVLYVWGNAMAERAEAVRKASKSAIPAQNATDASPAATDASPPATDASPAVTNASPAAAGATAATGKPETVRAAASPRAGNATSTATVPAKK